MPPEPISTTTAPAPHLPEPEPPAIRLPPVSIERAADEVAALTDAGLCGAPPGGPDETQLHAVLDAYRDHGGPGVYALLDSNAEVRASLGRLSPDQLECALASLEGSTGWQRLFSLFRTPAAPSIVSNVEEFFEGRMHSLTVLDGQARVRAGLAALDALAGDLPSRLDALRTAAPGSRDATLATMLGVRGDAGDLDRARERIASARDQLVEFGSRLPGSTWALSDFPLAGARALETLGLADAPAGSIADVAAGEPHSHLSSVVGWTLNAGHVAMIAGETAIETMAAGVTRAAVLAHAPILLGPFAAGLALEVYIHRLNVESHAEFVRTGRSLGM